MTELRHPNESQEYRLARDKLLVEEQALLRKVKEVAALRRELPVGGLIPEDYIFEWAIDDKVGVPVKMTELFNNKNTLLIYSFMYGPSWDHPCPSCTSIMDGLDRMANQVGHDATIVGIAKAPASKINNWASTRGWSQIGLVSGFHSSYQADYHCQSSDERQFPAMHVFQKEGDQVRHFWGTEMNPNEHDLVWPYWNLFDLTPMGRPERANPPQDFRSRYLEENYID